MTAQLDRQGVKDAYAAYWNKIMDLAGKKVAELYPDAADDGVCEWFSANEQIFSEEKRLYDRLGDLWGKDFEAFKKAAVDYAQMHVRIFKGYSEWKKTAAQKEGLR